MSKRGIETVVGAFVLLGMAALLFLALKAANLASFGDGQGYEVKARFDNIGGLKPRSPVRSAGVVVGRVTSIALDPKSFQGVVTMRIDHGLVFPKDSSAKILTAGLLGDQYIGIEAGVDDKNLAAGDTIRQTHADLAEALALVDALGHAFMLARKSGTGAP